MMPILVKSDDVRKGRKAKVRYGRHRCQWVKIQFNTIDLSTRLLEINLTNSVVIPKSLILRSIVLD